MKCARLHDSMLTSVNMHRSFRSEENRLVTSLEYLVVPFAHVTIATVARENTVEVAAESINKTLGFGVRLALNTAATYRICSRGRGRERKQRKYQG